MRNYLLYNMLADSLHNEVLWNLLQNFCGTKMSFNESFESFKDSQYSILSKANEIIEADFTNSDINLLNLAYQQAMFEIHQPENWVFGHWHTNFKQCINNTKFKCLPELTYVKL